MYISWGIEFGVKQSEGALTGGSRSCLAYGRLLKKSLYFTKRAFPR